MLVCYCYVQYVVHVLKRFVAVVAMACLSPSRLCARVQDKLLCQFGHKVRRQTVFVKLKPPGPSPLRIFGKTCQRVTTCGPACGSGGASVMPAGAARRLASSLQSTSTGSLPDYGTQIVDPYRLLEDDLNGIYEDIRSELERNTNQAELNTIATYYFDGQGKALRPMVAILMARAVNYHVYGENSALLPSQRQVAMISEMIHSASLIHDDVIDQSDFRRGKPSVNVLWNHKKVAMAGDFILAVASMMIARLRSDEVTLVLSQVVTDLVQGEFMQLGSKETENERFAHYLTKTYRKTASLIANSVKAVALLSGADEGTCELAFQYGRNLGLSFQLVDDLLDFVSSAQAMGKPTAADLRLGLATAPVLFACEKYPELNPMIMRRFQEAGDVEKAFELVHKSRGLEQTRFLARKHGAEAARLAAELGDSPYQKGLVVTTDLVLNRIK
ncbi:all trans-polyprenyl-diphosphate synthase PDSS1 [Epargyreus clarus]|uniref:all trans-polyprenyl-diphosphate synthase PDSS1 n=1 Tax=Epargyreus clarus TaxID=520877 RepID=UPI003C2DE175